MRDVCPRRWSTEPFVARAPRNPSDEDLCRDADEGLAVLSESPSARNTKVAARPKAKQCFELRVFSLENQARPSEHCSTSFSDVQDTQENHSKFKTQNHFLKIQRVNPSFNSRGVKPSTIDRLHRPSSHH